MDFKMKNEMGSGISQDFWLADILRAWRDICNNQLL